MEIDPKHFIYFMLKPLGHLPSEWSDKSHEGFSKINKHQWEGFVFICMKYILLSLTLL